MIYPYCRVSSGKQLEGLSLTLQNDSKLLDDLANRFNTTVSDRVYQDDGLSAYKGDHLKKGQLKQLIEDIKNNIIKQDDIIVMRHLDRLSRLEYSESMNLFNTIVYTHKVIIYTTMDNREYRYDIDNTTKAVNGAIVGFAFATANEESLRKSYYSNKNSLAQLKRFQNNEKHSSGYPYYIGGTVPFFAKTSGDKQTPVKPSKHWDLAKELVQYALQGNGITRCTDFLRKNNLEYTRQGVRDILANENLFGRLNISLQNTSYKLDNYYIKNTGDGVETICSEEEFYQLQSQISTRRKGNGQRKEYSLLSGSKMLHCACGSSMSVHHSKNGKKYYNCNNQACNLVPCYTLDNLIMNAVSTKVFTSTTDDKNLLGLKAKLKSKSEELKEAQAFAFEHRHLFGEQQQQQLEEMVNTVNSLEEEIELEQQRVYTPTVDNLSLGSYDSWQDKIHDIVNGSSETKKTYHDEIRKRVDDIVVDKDGLVTITFIDNKSEYYYFPINKKKYTGERRAIKLNVVDDATKQSITLVEPVLANTTFTLDDIKNKSYQNNIENFNHTVLYSEPHTANNKEKLFANDIKKILGGGTAIWKKSIFSALGISDKRWQTNKDIDLSLYGIKSTSVKYITPKGNQTTAKLVYINEPDFSVVEGTLL